jgi:hypothetical protein
MQEAFHGATSQINGELQKTEREKIFVSFIHDTRASITKLLSSGYTSKENDLGSWSVVTMEGFFIDNIDPIRDLNIPNVADDCSMEVFIGREKVGRIGAWINARTGREPRMGVTAKIKHTPSDRVIDNYEFIFESHTINALSDQQNVFREVKHRDRGQAIKLITDVLNFAAENPSRRRK